MEPGFEAGDEKINWIGFIFDMFGIVLFFGVAVLYFWTAKYFNLDSDIVLATSSPFSFLESNCIPTDFFFMPI